MAFWTLMAKLGLDTSSYQAGMKRAESLAASAGAKMRASINSTAANYLGAAAVIALTKKTVDLASTLADTSAKLDVSTTALQEFYWAAEKAGGSIEDVNKFLELLAVNKRKALMSPDGEQGLAFAQLGISIDDLRNGRIEDLTRKIGKVFEAGDPQKLMGALRAVGGKSAASMAAPLINGLGQAADEAKRLGMIMDEDVVQKLDAMGDKAAEVGKRIISTISEPLAWMFDKINAGLDYLQRSMDVIAGFYTAFKEGVPDKNAYVKAFINEQYQEREKIKTDAEATAKNRARTIAGAREFTDDTEEKQTTIKATKKSASSDFDPLAKIGGLFLGADAAMRSIGERQLTEAKRSNRHLEKISGALSKPVA